MKIWLSVAAMLLPIAASTGQGKSADEPSLLKATMWTHTNDEDKDHDTCINLT
jgi:hypothetical protein